MLILQQILDVRSSGSAVPLFLRGLYPSLFLACSFLPSDLCFLFERSRPFSHFLELRSRTPCMGRKVFELWGLRLLLSLLLTAKTHLI